MYGFKCVDCNISETWFPERFVVCLDWALALRDVLRIEKGYLPNGEKASPPNIFLSEHRGHTILITDDEGNIYNSAMEIG